MSDMKTHNWLYDLKHYALNKEAKEEYLADVHTQSCITVEDIAQLIVAERTEYRHDTIVTIANLIEEKIQQLLCQGYAVQTGTAHYAPSITGVFTDSSGTFNPAVNACTVSVSPTKALREEVAKVHPEFSGYVQELGGARIDLVTDTVTGKTNGTITPEGILDVVGCKIKCLNADGSAIGKVLLVNTATQAETPITTLATNHPARLVFLVPASLPAGSYRLRIETYYSTGQLLKTARTIEYHKDLVVSTAGGSGD